MSRNLWELHATGAGVDRSDHLALIDQAGATLTHAELSQQAAKVADALPGLRLASGDIVGVFWPNRTCWPILALAAARAGVGTLGLNTRFREAELEHLTEVAKVDLAFVPDEFLGLDGPKLFGALDRQIALVVEQVSESPPDPESPHSLWRDLAPAASMNKVEISEPGPGRPHHPLIGFTTSGTTGFPKIAMHSNAQTMAHLQAVTQSFDFGPDTVALVPLPLCGAFGYSVAMSVLIAGGTVVLHETWSPAAAVEAMIDFGVTYFAGGDLMLLEVADHARFGEVTTWTSGTFADFANAGRQAVETTADRSGGTTQLTGVYGSSEGFALMSIWPKDASLDDRARGGGYLVSTDMAVRCCDPSTGRELGHGTQGEIHFRGPNLITEYLNNPDATEGAFTPDGWYRSGDLGFTVPPHVDGRQGFVFLARLGDSLRLRGFLCDPAEIERHLESHGDVQLAQVVGAQRPGEGDVAVAFVQKAPGTDISIHDLDEHCRHGLANYKRPSHIELVTEFPVTEGPNGTKIRKVELRERAQVLLDDSTH